jgi:hypothetical protein
MVQVGSQKYRRMSNFFSFSYLSWDQIWLNLPHDDCHFGYITKLTGKILYISLSGKCFFSYCMIIQSPANKHVRILTNAQPQQVLIKNSNSSSLESFASRHPVTPFFSKSLLAYMPPLPSLLPLATHLLCLAFLSHSAPDTPPSSPCGQKSVRV